MALEGKIQIQSDIVPTNDNPRMPVTQVKYVKGAPQTFGSIVELIAFHPNLMLKGMNATVMNWPAAGTVTKFVLNVDPGLLLDSNGDSVITEANFNQYWEIENQTATSQVRVRQYAPDGPGGGAPTYPYTIGTESNWSNTLDYNKGHKWMRWRDDDIDDNADGIFDNWTVPVSILNAFSTGDYIDKRFKREGVIATFDVVHSGIGTLTPNEYYVVESDDIEVTGDLSLIDIGSVETNGTVVLSLGRTFKYVTSLTYNFSYGMGAGTVRRIIKTPPRTESGLPNNEPAGWLDTPPAGTDQLWEISGQKSVYGQLKSDWLLKKIIEDPNYTRYSNSASPHPDSLCGINEAATTGSPADLRLEAEGWHTVYGQEAFIARRQDDGGSPPFTTWLVEKISEESGEYIDRVFKLFDLNLDIDSVLLSAPTDRDPAREGWSDSPLSETATQINYVSEARKFFDGTLKTSWSKPVPFTGKDVFTDTIDATPADNFKYDSAGVADPTEIKLTSRLYKGTDSMWEQFGITISYAWKIVYNGGAIVNIAPTSNPADDFYIESVTGSGTADAGGSATVLNDAAGNFVAKGVQVGDKVWNVTDGSYALVALVSSATSLITEALQGGTLNTWTSGHTYFLEVDGFLQAGQRVVVKPNAIDGQCVIRCTQTITMPQGDDLVFEDEISLLDITDGKDAKSLTLTADAQRFLYDTVGLVFSPLNLVLRAYWSNLPGITLYWYEWNGASWDALTNGVDNYSIAGNTLTSTAANRFAADATAQEIRYAVSTHASNPDSADYETDFSDYLTIAKLSAANIGVDGDNAISMLLDNEAHTMVLLNTTGAPETGEITSSGKAITLVELFDGLAALEYGVDYTLGLASDNAGVTFAQQASGTNGLIYISAWTAFERSAVCTITATYGARTIVKKFSVATTLDAPGAIILDIDSDKGFEFTPSDKTDKTLTGKLYDTGLTGDQLLAFTPGGTYYYQWKVAGGAFSSPSNAAGANTKLVTRADILASANVTVRVSLSPTGTPIYRERTISMSDVVDGRSYRAWTVATSVASNQKLTNQDPTGGGWPYTINTVLWRLQTDPWWAANPSSYPVFAQDASVDPITGNWVWSAPYQISGEKGDQGESGNFVFPMYKATYKVEATQADIASFAAGSASYTFTKGSIILLNTATLPNVYYYNGGSKTDVGSYTTTQVTPDFGAGGAGSTLAQMLGSQGAYVDWFSRPPFAGIVWKTERIWKSVTGGGDQVTFNVNGDPDTDPVSGTQWTAPVMISSMPGRSIKGDTGSLGWTPSFLIESDGERRVLKLNDFINGEGTKPALPTDRYVGSTGMVPTAALGVDIRGEQGPAGAFEANAVITYQRINELLTTVNLNTTNNIWPNGSSGHEWVDSNTFSQQGTWLNTTGKNVWIHMEVEGAAYNTQNGAARLELYLGVSAGAPSFADQPNISGPVYYSPNRIPTILTTSGMRYVPAGETLYWGVTLRAIQAPPNYLWQRFGLKIMIVA
jgi:hypothetical protein